MPVQTSLGTLLRRLLELLDGEVQSVYDAAGLMYRPRYTPVVRAIEARGPVSIRSISDHSGMSHSAVSQTVAQMVRGGLVRQASGQDARERIVSATPALIDMLPTLHRLWAATNRAAAELEDELPYPLAAAAVEAIQALETKSFGERIRNEGKSAC